MLQRTSRLLHRHGASVSAALPQRGCSSGADQAGEAPSTSGSSSPPNSPNQDRDRRARQQLIEQVLRQCHAAEAAATHFFAGQQAVLRNRPDAAQMTEREAEQLERLQRLMPRYHVRPSLLLPAAQAVGVGLGALAALAPSTVKGAVLGGMQDAYVDVYTEQLRTLREAGLSDQAPEVREVVKSLRDLERAPEGAPPAPDLLTLQRMEKLEDIGLTGLVGAVVKAVTQQALGLTRRI